MKKDKNNNSAGLGFEEKLWSAADKMRNNMDPAEYKHVVLGLIFLKYISDSFEEHYSILKNTTEADPEDRDEYIANNIFWVTKEARWSNLKNNATSPNIGILIDDAMIAIEKDNPSLKGVLAKNYGRPDLDKIRLGELINLISTIGLGDAENRSKDILGRVYEYFLGRFASAEGKGGGEFFTPKSVVKLLVEMIEPYSGRVLDPCCGSGGMFVQSESFIESHGGNKDKIAIFGQESNPTTWRLCKMNLAIRGISGDIGKIPADSFHNDQHKDLKADFVLANPPFNVSDWGGERLREDVRWKFGTPPVGSGNYAWIQHFIHHLSPSGSAGFVMSNGALSTNDINEAAIRANLVKSGLVDCIVALPNKLFYSTAIPACLWFISREKNKNKNRVHKDEVLFIDAGGMGMLVDRDHRELSSENIAKIKKTYEAWLRGTDVNVMGYSKSVKISDIEKSGFVFINDSESFNKYVLIPGRYVGEDGTAISTYPPIDYRKALDILKNTHSEACKLEEEIKSVFKKYKIGFDGPLAFAKISTLVSLGNQIFHEWFTELNYYGKGNDTTPKGCRLGHVKELGRVVCGKTPSTTEEYYFGGDIPFIKIPDMHNQVFIVDSEETLSNEGAESQKNKMLPPFSICTSCIATVGLVSLTSKISQTNQQINSLVPLKDIYRYFLYFSLIEMKQTIINFSKGGSATLNLNTTDFGNLNIYIPDDSVLEEFHELMDPIFKLILLRTK